MSLDRLSEAASNLTAWIVTTLAGGVIWVIRRVLTNQKQIEMLHAEIAHRDQMRQRDREDMQEVKSDVKELRTEIRAVFNRGHE